MNPLCYLSNAAPHYRRAIFERIDREMDSHFYIGDKAPGITEYMDFRSLRGFRAEVHNVKLIGNLYWQRKTLWLAFGPYNRYLIDGEPICLSTWLLLLILRLRGRPATLWSHGWYGDEGFLKRSLKKIFFGLAGTTLLYGNHARELMISHGFDPRKLVCIYNSLDYDRQVVLRMELEKIERQKAGDQIRHEGQFTGEWVMPAAKVSFYRERFGNDDPVILFIGRIQPSKKTGLLLQAWERLNREGTPCNLVMIGEVTEDLRDSSAAGNSPDPFPGGSSNLERRPSQSGNSPAHVEEVPAGLNPGLRPTGNSTDSRGEGSAVLERRLRPNSNSPAHVEEVPAGLNPGLRPTGNSPDNRGEGSAVLERRLRPNSNSPAHVEEVPAGLNPGLRPTGNSTDSRGEESAVLERRLWLTGALFDEPTLAACIYHAAVCVSPGNVGLAAIHSLTYGTPVITHNNPVRQGPEFEAITPAITGDFFREDDVGDLCRVIKHWISIGGDQREAVRGSCYRTIEERYTPSYQIRILKEVLNLER